MKKLLLLLLLMPVIALSACSSQEGGNDGGPAMQDGEIEEYALEESDEDPSGAEGKEEGEMSRITMKINDEIISVRWEENESVRALAALAAEAPVTVNTSMYGGFEQVGSLGTTLPSNDTGIRTKPGDIVLYTSDSIVVFFGSNSWSYTKLGHIEDKSAEELRALLGGNSAVITFAVE